MLIYRVTFDVDNGYSGQGYQYFGTRSQAERYATQERQAPNSLSPGAPKEVTVTPVLFPSRKTEICEFLNRWHSQADL